ncbi:MAG: septum formation protein [Candidatus Peribacteria bacterium]|nr:septum formation protein [Candidatus Peribacteria bacterium]
MNQPSRLILASSSPQRKTLLQGLGLDFEVVPSAFNESDHVEHDPAKRAMALAELKAADVAAKNPSCWVIGCDTLVVSADGTLLEKPLDEAEARSMLQAHSGSTSLVHSGLCVIAPTGERIIDISTSKVQFKELSEQDMDWWLSDVARWKNSSGAFKIDGPGQLMIERIEGDWTSIVGLPVFLLGKIMRQMRAPFLS